MGVVIAQPPRRDVRYCGIVRRREILPDAYNG